MWRIQLEQVRHLESAADQVRARDDGTHAHSPNNHCENVLVQNQSCATMLAPQAGALPWGQSSHARVPSKDYPTSLSLKEAAEQHFDPFGSGKFCEQGRRSVRSDISMQDYSLSSSSHSRAYSAINGLEWQARGRPPSEDIDLFSQLAQANHSGSSTLGISLSFTDPNDAALVHALSAHQDVGPSAIGTQNHCRPRQASETERGSATKKSSRSASYVGRIEGHPAIPRSPTGLSRPNSHERKSTPLKIAKPLAKAGSSKRRGLLRGDELDLSVFNTSEEKTPTKNVVRTSGSCRLNASPC